MRRVKLILAVVAMMVMLLMMAATPAIALPNFGDFFSCDFFGLRIGSVFFLCELSFG